MISIGVVSAPSFSEPSYHLASLLRVSSFKDLKSTSTQRYAKGNRVCEIAVSQNSTPESFGLLLYTFRNRLGITQRDAASRCAISIAYYSALENSKRPPPPTRRVIGLGVALGASSREQAYLHALAKAERLTHRALPTARRDIQGLVQHLLVHGPSLAPSLIQDLLRRVSYQTRLHDRNDEEPAPDSVASLQTSPCDQNSVRRRSQRIHPNQPKEKNM